MNNQFSCEGYCRTCSVKLDRVVDFASFEFSAAALGYFHLPRSFSVQLVDFALEAHWQFVADFYLLH